MIGTSYFVDGVVGLFLCNVIKRMRFQMSFLMIKFNIKYCITILNYAEQRTK